MNNVIKMELKDFVGKMVCVTDAKKEQHFGEVLKFRREENDEDSIIMKLPFGHIVLWESDIQGISPYEPKRAAR